MEKPQDVQPQQFKKLPLEKSIWKTVWLTLSKESIAWVLEAL